MNAFKRFHQVASAPDAYAGQWKKMAGRRVLGHFCTYTPEEVILAADALPFRIFGSDRAVSLADAHLQSYSCSLVRNALADALSGRLAFLDGTVFPHTCDSIQRLSDIWRLNAGLGFHLDLVLPVKLNTDSARAYLFDVLGQFRRDLENAFHIEITDRSLRAAIRLTNRIRLGLKRMYDLKALAPERIAMVDVHAAVAAAMVMDKSDYAEALTRTVHEIEKHADTSVTARKRLVVTGGVCAMPDVFKFIEDSGGAVVADDLCTGSRYFAGLVPETGDPIAALAQRYAERMVCPAKHAGLHRRADHLVETVRKHHANGVIVMVLKFCDPHGFDYPYLKQRLEAEDLPHLLLEVEAQAAANEQLYTRIEAFIESL